MDSIVSVMTTQCRQEFWLFCGFTSRQSCRQASVLYGHVPVCSTNEAKGSCSPCRAALESIQGVALEAVMPMFKAMVEAAEDIILRLHIEDFGQEQQQGMTQASAYMQALTAHLNHCRWSVLSTTSRTLTLAYCSSLLPGL